MREDAGSRRLCGRLSEHFDHISESRRPAGEAIYEAPKVELPSVFLLLLLETYPLQNHLAVLYGCKIGMVSPRFVRPRGAEAVRSSNLFVANCGPAVGLSYDDIASAFGKFGQVEGVYPADESGARVIVSFSDPVSAQAALTGLDRQPCPDLAGRCLHIRYSALQSPRLKVGDHIPVSHAASDLNIPGLYLWHDFVSAKEEEDLLASVDKRPWNSLSKRRVQHYGYEFCYDTRNVDKRKYLGVLPSFVSSVLQRIAVLPEFADSTSLVLDQLTVNEYPPGVGLSPHIDTHSAFEGLIFSLSLAGPCIMEFRRYNEGAWHLKAASSTDLKLESSENHIEPSRKAIFLPPRSMLLLTGEARYAWHHYIPHHKIDKVNDAVIKRTSRRVSFTFRKVRKDACRCSFPQYCDSQNERTV